MIGSQMLGGLQPNHWTKLPHKGHWHLKQFKNMRQNEPKCLMFNTVPLDFSGFQGYQNAKTVDDNTI